MFERYVRDHFGGAGSGGGRPPSYVNMHEGELAPHAREVMDAVPGTYIKGYIALATSSACRVDVVVTGADEAEAQAHLERAVTMLTELVAGRGTAGEQVSTAPQPPILGGATASGARVQRG